MWRLFRFGMMVGLGAFLPFSPQYVPVAWNTASGYFWPRPPEGSYFAEYECKNCDREFRCATPLGMPKAKYNAKCTTCGCYVRDESPAGVPQSVRVMAGKIIFQAD